MLNNQRVNIYICDNFATKSARRLTTVALRPHCLAFDRTLKASGHCRRTESTWNSAGDAAQISPKQVNFTMENMRI